MIYLYLFCILGLCIPTCEGGEAAAEGEKHRQKAEQRYLALKQEWSQQPENVETGWRFGQACFEWADYSENKQARACLAEEGIAACEAVLQAKGDEVGGQYYLAMNLGQLARTKSLGALRLVRQMEEHFLKAVALDPGFYHAGPCRSLGMLYRDAPGWPASIGHRSKARKYLNLALKHDDGFPETHLVWVESLLSWDEERQAREYWPQVQSVMESARSRFQLEDNSSRWADWERRFAQLQERMGTISPTR